MMPGNKMQETREREREREREGDIIGGLQTQNKGPFELTSDRTVNEGTTIKRRAVYIMGPALYEEGY